VLRHNSEYLHAVVLVTQQSGSSKLAWVIKGMLYISVTCLLVSHL
jgi:hypothetical protein